jgi:hypothetical protein
MNVTSWKQWVSDFKRGRTHTAYALIVGVIYSAIEVVISPSIPERIYATVMLVASTGGLVDTVAHLFYH